MGFAPLLNPQYVAAPSGAQPARTTAPTQPAPLGGARTIVDGTPLRVVYICVGAAVGLTALRWGGIRFNVGVSS